MASNSALIIPPQQATPMITATNDIRPIKPPVVIHNPWEIAAWSAGITLAVVLVSLAVWLWWKRRLAPQPVIIPPHVRARERLNAALTLIHDPRAFCIAVSDAVRIYLEERFQLRAPERTTEEFLRDLQTTTHLNEDQKQTLAAFLEQCDLVKFARFEPDEAALRVLHETALRLVHETQFDPITAPASGVSSPPPQIPPPPPVVP
jgi:hypothetical protein